jgi:fatty acid CoA ligase FadD36
LSLLGNGEVPGDPDRGAHPAVTVAGEALDRADLFAAAAAVADRVQGAPVAAVLGTASLETVVAIVGCLLAGVPAVPVPPDAGPRERHHILRDSRAVVWLGESADDVPEGVETVPVDPARRSRTRWTEPEDGIGLIMYTSGTTGAPKGAVLSRAALAAGLDGLADAWQWTRDDVLVHGLPLFHVHGLVLGVLGALRVGSPLIHTRRPRPEAYAEAAERGGSLFFGVPTVWSRVAADPGSAKALSGARLLVSGSAALPPSVFRDIAALTGQAPVERYGMSETLITLACRADAERRAGWVGTPINGVRARVVDDHGAPVEPDGETIGNLQIRGATLFDGYLGREQATAESFTGDGWFRTGDAAAVDRTGNHRIVGRISADLIKTGGYRVGAGEIEAALLDHPSVTEAAVVGLPDADLGQRIVAFVVGDGPRPDVLIEHIASQLSVHKRPREIRVVDSLPRNAMGKVQKAKLTE